MYMGIYPLKLKDEPEDVLYLSYYQQILCKDQKLQWIDPTNMNCL